MGGRRGGRARPARRLGALAGAGVTVAVIDSGARLEHPDLAPNVWVNFDEVPGNRVDDDANGYVDDVHGVDLTTSARGRQDLTDGNGHGTHVAGIIAGAANGRGVVGVAFRARLMIVKVLDARGAGTTGAVAEGIRYAAANGARIINLSLGGPTRDPRLVEAVKGGGGGQRRSLVCSAGNLGNNVDDTPSYPVALASCATWSASRPPSRRTAATSVVLELRPEHDRARRARRGRAVERQRRRLRVQERDVDGGAARRRGRGADGRDAARTCRPPSCARSCSRTRRALAAGRRAATSTRSARSSSVARASTLPARAAAARARPRAQRKGSQTSCRWRRSATRGGGALPPQPRRPPRGRAAQRSSPFTVSPARAGGRKLRVDALDAGGKEIAAATRAVRGVRKGKRGAAAARASARSGDDPVRALALAVLLAALAPSHGDGGEAADQDERRGHRHGAHRRPGLLLPARGRRAAALRAGGRRRGDRDRRRRRAGSRRRARRPRADPGDPAGLVFTPIARDGICLVTNAATRSRIRPGADPGARRRPHHELVAGAGLPAAPIRSPPVAHERAAAARARRSRRDVVDPATPLELPARTFASALQVRDYLKVTPNAWGYVDLAFAGDLHVVPFDGSPCTRATVASERIPGPHSSGSSRAARPKGRVARFMRWSRSSRKARRVIATRYVPVRASS